MQASFASLTRIAKRFARDEGGALTIEAVLWIPFFFVVLMLITDASLAFFSKAEAFRMVQNGNRLLSVGTLTSDDAVETWVEEAFTETTNDSANTTISADNTIVSTQLSFPLEDVLLFNWFGVSSDWNITVTSQHYVEWPNP